MGVWHLRSKRKNTGGLLRRDSKSKKSQMGSLPTQTTIAPIKLKEKKTRGGSVKKTIISTDKINVFDKTKKAFKIAKIISIVKNPANPHFIRRTLMTKGAIIKTDMGNVKITSRPGQNPSLNGVLAEK
ncbi:MAG: 30S ribosomal protein S8e [Candidatus Aenigmarchaeota archaeon]|nr:30S ribosomal protein S8e [Candidatus Aenigmarchaeota archaeon]